MSANIYKDKFITYRQPAWHNIGTIIDEQISASEAASRIKLPIITTESVVTLSGLPTSHKAIIGQNDEGKQVFNVVSNQYHEVTHHQFVELWDRVVKSHIDTIGLLGSGETLFIVAQLPKFDVKGDEVQSYLMAMNPLTGNQAITGVVSGVRTVCQNTLLAALSSFTQKFRVVHKKDPVSQIEGFLKEVWEGTTAKVETLREAFNLLASTRVADDEAKEVFQNVYPDLEAPVNLMNATPTDRELDKLAAWERENGRQQVHREKTFALFDGDGVGSMSEAAKGTAWGAYNAVVEYEQYLKRFARPESVVFGAAADRIKTAFSECHALARM